MSIIADFAYITGREMTRWPLKPCHVHVAVTKGSWLKRFGGWWQKKGSTQEVQLDEGGERKGIDNRKQC